MQDLANEDCSSFTELTAPVCSLPCEIFDVIAEAHPCEDGFFFVDIDFEYSNVSGDGFQIVGNGNNYGNFQYGETFYTIGPIQGNGQNLEFVVQDLVSEDCSNFTELMAPSCLNCEIGAIEFTALECNPDGTFNAILNFEYSNVTNNFFDLRINGELINFYAYADLPIIVSNITQSGDAFETVTICDNDNTDCCNGDEFPAIGCGDVWPGDADFDNIANNFDILNIGIAFGFEGPDRPSMNTTWNEWAAQNWSESFETGVNYKHADCDGNGVVNADDVLVNSENYNLTHGEVEPYEMLPSDEDDPPFFIDFPDPSEIEIGVPFTAELILGSFANPIADIYGLAYSLEFDDDMVNVENVQINYVESWFGNPTDMISLQKNFQTTGRIDAAISRVNQENKNGFGKIADIIIIIDDLAGRIQLDNNIVDVKPIRYDEVRVPLHLPNTTLDVKALADKHLDLSHHLSVYPNPVNDILHIESSYEEKIESITLLNTLGEKVKILANPNRKTKINTSYMNSGIYFVELKYKNASICKKVSVF